MADVQSEPVVADSLLRQSIDWMCLHTIMVVKQSFLVSFWSNNPRIVRLIADKTAVQSLRTHDKKFIKFSHCLFYVVMLVMRIWAHGKARGSVRRGVRYDRPRTLYGQMPNDRPVFPKGDHRGGVQYPSGSIERLSLDLKVAKLTEKRCSRS